VSKPFSSLYPIKGVNAGFFDFQAIHLLNHFQLKDPVAAGSGGNDVSRELGIGTCSKRIFF